MDRCAAGKQPKGAKAEQSGRNAMDQGGAVRRMAGLEGKIVVHVNWDLAGQDGQSDGVPPCKSSCWRAAGLDSGPGVNSRSVFMPKRGSGGLLHVPPPQARGLAARIALG